MSNNSRAQTNGRSSQSNGGSSRDRGVFSDLTNPSSDVERSELSAQEAAEVDSRVSKAPTTPESKEPLEPLTVSLPSSLARQARIIVVAQGITMSKLVMGLLGDAVARELPLIIAELSGITKGNK